MLADRNRIKAGIKKADATDKAVGHVLETKNRMKNAPRPIPKRRKAATRKIVPILVCSVAVHILDGVPKYRR